MNNSASISFLTAALLLAATVPASAQGIKQGTSGPQTNSASRSGVGTNTRPDTMGGAFKGTGTPTYGTSPGMGSGMGSGKKARN